MLHAILAWIESSKYILLFFGAIAEGPVLMLSSGVLYHLGAFMFLPMYLALLLGDFVGDLIWYFLGRFGGERFIVRYGRRFGLAEDTLHKIERRFLKHHEKILVISKLTMGLGFSQVVLFVAGMFKVSFWKYVLINLFGGLIWVAFLLTIGYFFGNVYALVPESLKIAFVAVALPAAFFGFRALNRYLKTQEL